MSKKLYSTAKWKRQSLRRQVDELSRLQKRREKLRQIPPTLTARQAQKRRARGYTEIDAPSRFSLIDNPEEVIQFFNRIEAISEATNVSLDLRGVKLLTTDAVAALVATIGKPAISRAALIRGNQPEGESARNILIQSGFFSHVSHSQELPRVAKGRIAQKQSKKVEPETARDLVHLGMNGVFGEPRRCQPAYRVLIESMNNTRNHAAGSTALRETWWATAYADVERQRVCYTFLDTGVGIFKSIRLGKLRQLYRLVGLTDQTSILRDILEGKVESSTRQPYRGKGLPAIYQQFQWGALKRLVLIANDVFADVGNNDYRSLKIPFQGTLLYWET